MENIKNNTTTSSSLFLMLGCMAFSLLLLCAPEYAYAGGLDKVNKFMENIADILRGASIISVTVALMLAGYKYLFTDTNLAQIGKIALAGLLIGGAAEIARYIAS